MLLALQLYFLPATHYQPPTSLNHHLKNSIFLSPLLDYLHPEYLFFFFWFTESKFLKSSITENIFILPSH